MLAAASPIPRTTTSTTPRAAEEALPQIWQCLSNQDWPVRQVEAYLPRIVAQASSLSPEWRSRWISALHTLWQRYSWAVDTETCKALLHLSSLWCSWPLAESIGNSLQAADALDTGAALSLLNSCRHLGQHRRALDLAITLQFTRHDESAFSQAYQELLEWFAWRSRWGNIDGCDWGDKDLLLEPMGHHHLSDFAWQYYDPAIAERCSLPTFQNGDQWYRWLDHIYRGGDQRVDAVIHRQWGFIGSVSLILHGGIGYFYYWLGRDFQGQGYGPRAVALLLAAATERYGLHTCYAKVYDYNSPSRKALEKLGFEDIQVSAAAPDDNEMFYRRGPAADRHRIAEELHWLLAAMASNTRPAILLQPGN